MPQNDYKYDAFISYSRKDKAFAEKLEHALENYRPPKGLGLENKYLKIFRDEKDIEYGPYEENIEEHIKASAKLLVICSPNARTSEYVNQEIQIFLNHNLNNNIAPIIIDGVIDYEATSGQENMKAFPNALVEAMKIPLAIDYRNFNTTKQDIKKDFSNSWYSILAKIYKIDRDIIEQLDKKKIAKQRRTWLSLTASAFVILTALTFYAFAQRNVAINEKKRADSNAQIAADSAKVAQAQRREAIEQKNRADSNARIAADSARVAQEQRAEAQRRLYEANYNLAKIYEEKATAYLDKDPETGQPNPPKAWLYTLAALKQKIPPHQTLPLSLGRTAQRELIDNHLLPLFTSSPYQQKGSVLSVAFSPDGSRIVSASTDNTINLWNVSSGQVVLSLSGQTGFVTCIAFSPDGTQIASGSSDATIKLWNASAGHELFALTVDNKSKEKKGTEYEIMKMFGNADHLTCIAFSVDGRRLVSATTNGTINIWDTLSGINLLTIPKDTIEKADPLTDLKEFQNLSGITKFISDLEFSPDGNRFVSSSGNGTIILWNADTGENLLTLPNDKTGINSISFNPDGNKIAAGATDGTIKVWDISTHELIRTFIGHTDEVLSVDYSLDGKFLVSGSKDNTIKLWDTNTGNVISTISGHKSDVLCVAYSPDGKRIASGSMDTTMRVWEVATGSSQSMFDDNVDAVWSVVYNQDGSRIASGSDDGKIKIWDTYTGELLFDIAGNKKHIQPGVLSIAFSPDGTRLASTSRDGTINLWSVITGEALSTLSGHTNEVFSVVYNSDGKLIASGSRDNTIRIWDTIFGIELFTLTGCNDGVWAVKFNPNGNQVASASFDNTIKLWNALTGNLLLTLSGHKGAINSIAYNNNGKLIISVAEDGMLKIWNSSTGTELSTFTDPPERLRSVAISPDGSKIAYGIGSGFIKVLNFSSMKEIAIFSGHNGTVTSLSFCPDGNSILSGSLDSSIRIRNMRLVNSWSNGTPFFEKLFEASQYVFDYELQNLELVEKSRSYFKEAKKHGSLSKRTLQKLDQSRRLGVSPIDWLTDNLEEQF